MDQELRNTGTAMIRNTEQQKQSFLKFAKKIRDDAEEKEL